MSDSSRQHAFPALPNDPSGARSFDWWINAHAEQLQLCAELEAIADSLPANVNRQKCLYAAKALWPLIKGLHHYEENVLFPSLERGGLADELARTLTRLRFEHFEDECFAEELTERLLLLGAGASEINMEATGYMLRGFFEAVRRHVAFEREYLLNKLEPTVLRAVN